MDDYETDDDRMSIDNEDGTMTFISDWGDGLKELLRLNDEGKLPRVPRRGCPNRRENFVHILPLPLKAEKLAGAALDNLESYIALGLIFVKEGKIEEAIKCYQSAICKFPRSSELYTNLGYCFEKHMMRNDLAVVCYEKAVELDPSDEWALNNIGFMFQREGNARKALLYFEKACYFDDRKNDGYVSAHFLHNLAWGHYLCHEYNEASNVFYEIQDIKVSDALYWADFGCVKYKMGFYSEALRFFEKAVQIKPERRRFQGLYKLALRKAG